MVRSDPNWNQIVAEVGPCLYRYFCGSFQPERASDLVQESLIRLVKKHRSGDFDSSKGTFKAYAIGIARFVRLEALKIDPGFDLVEDQKTLDPGAEDKCDQADHAAHLRWAIKKLKPVEQEILLLMIDSESSLDEIALMLAMPLGTIKSHVHRAKESLRQLMEANK